MTSTTNSLNVLKNERGIALVVAISLITLLASLGIWLIMESQGGLRLTKALERIEGTFHLAEGGCWLSLHAFDNVTVEVPDNSTLVTLSFPGVSFMQPNQSLGKNRYVTPYINSSRDFYNTVPPEGWEITHQGASSFRRDYFLLEGTGEIDMPQSRGSASAVLFNLTGKVRR